MVPTKMSQVFRHKDTEEFIVPILTVDYNMVGIVLSSDCKKIEGFIKQDIDLITGRKFLALKPLATELIGKYRELTREYLVRCESLGWLSPVTTEGLLKFAVFHPRSLESLRSELFHFLRNDYVFNEMDMKMFPLLKALSAIYIEDEEQRREFLVERR